MWTKRRHKIVFAILRGPLRLFFKCKYNLKPYKYKLENKPYLILSNHCTTLDPFIVADSFKRPLYYMTSTDLFSSRFGNLISYLVAPIPKSKNLRDLSAIKNTVRVAKEGGTVCIFPEGNRCYDGNLCYIDPAISKLVKMIKLDVVIYNIHGGYGIDPRWCKKTRKGHSYSCVNKIIPYEEVKNMDNEELYNIIKEGLDVNQFDGNVKYKNRKNAEGLERCLYVCPICGKTQTLYTKGNYIYCKECGLKVKHNENMTLTSDNDQFKYMYVKDWYNYQIEYVKKYDFQDKEVIYLDDNVKLLKMRFRKTGKLLCKGTLKMTPTAFIISDGTKEITYLFDTIFSTTVLGRHKMNIYIDNETYQIKGKDELNVLKYMQMYFHIKHKTKGEEDEYFGL